jgi:hypothetical protein
MSLSEPLNRRVTFPIVSGLTLARMGSYFIGFLLVGLIPVFLSPSSLPEMA